MTDGVDLLVARSDSDYTVLLDKVLSDVSACMNLAVHGYVSIRKKLYITCGGFSDKG